MNIFVHVKIYASMFRYILLFKPNITLLLARVSKNHLQPSPWITFPSLLTVTDEVHNGSDSCRRCITAPVQSPPKMRYFVDFIKILLWLITFLLLFLCSKWCLNIVYSCWYLSYNFLHRQCKQVAFFHTKKGNTNEIYK